MLLLSIKDRMYKTVNKGSKRRSILRRSLFVSSGVISKDRSSSVALSGRDCGSDDSRNSEASALSLIDGGAMIMVTASFLEGVSRPR